MSHHIAVNQLHLSIAVLKTTMMIIMLITMQGNIECDKMHYAGCIINVTFM